MERHNGTMEPQNCNGMVETRHNYGKPNASLTLRTCTCVTWVYVRSVSEA